MASQSIEIDICEYFFLNFAWTKIILQDYDNQYPKILKTRLSNPKTFFNVK